jgi:hypothetical protein
MVSTWSSAETFTNGSGFSMKLFLKQELKKIKSHLYFISQAPKFYTDNWITRTEGYLN